MEDKVKSFLGNFVADAYVRIFERRDTKKIETILLTGEICTAYLVPGNPYGNGKDVLRIDIVSN